MLLLARCRCFSLSNTIHLLDVFGEVLQSDLFLQQDEADSKTASPWKVCSLYLYYRLHLTIILFGLTQVE